MKTEKIKLIYFCSADGVWGRPFRFRFVILHHKRKEILIAYPINVRRIPQKFFINYINSIPLSA
jgi:hypothetical protein